MQSKEANSSDNCTFYPEGSWTECCRRHDRRYEDKRLTKYQADKLLFRCVKRKSNILNAGIMFIGVTLFGHLNYRRARSKNGTC